MSDMMFLTKIILALFISLLALKLVNNALKMFFKVILFIVIFGVIWKFLNQVM